MRRKTASIVRRRELVGVNSRMFYYWPSNSKIGVLLQVFCLALFALMASACATVNIADATLRLRPERLMPPEEREKQSRFVAEWNAGTFNLPMLPTHATAEDIARVTPTRIRLDGIKPTDPKDKYRSSTVTVAIMTQSGMVCTGTVQISRFEYVVFGSWPWDIKWSDRSGFHFFWCPDNTAYFNVEIFKNRGVVNLVLAGEGGNTLGMINRTWDFNF